MRALAMEPGEKVDTETERAAALDSALQRKGYRLRFPPSLEAQFEREAGPQRCRDFVLFGLIGFVLCEMFLPNYFKLLPDIAGRELAVQVAFVIPVMLAITAYVRMEPPPVFRELSQVVAALVSLVASVAAYQGSAAPAAVLFRYSPVLTLLYVNVVAAVRFRFAAPASALTVLCSAVDLWCFEGPSSDIKSMVASSVVVTCGFTLLANYRLERQQRRTFLLHERERLRRDEVARLAAEQAREALDRAREREQAALADAARTAELRDAHRVARIGTWRRDLLEQTLTLSEELHQLLGTDPRSFDPTPENLIRLVHPDDRAAAGAVFARASGSTDVVEHEWRMMRPDGRPAWFWAETHIETDASGQALAVRGVCQDVTEYRATAERIHRLAHYDTLTGLANRSLLHERVTQAIARARRGGGKLAVLCLDLDGFKAVNDLHGHGAGDCLLCEVAARLGRDVRETDTVARLGGDEFVVLQTEDVGSCTARALAERLVEALGKPYDIGTGQAQAAVTASVGVALFPDDGEEPEILLHNADTALYRAKWAGKNRAAFFQPEMDRELRERRALERDLRQAAARGELSLAWQPLSAAGEGVITGFEVLLRWRHAERGLIPPDVFIPVAEACGAIVAIGDWVMREACREAARWTAPLHVAVNVSPVQAQNGEAFAVMVEEALSSSGLDPSRLVLEVTEGVLIRDADRVLAALNRLKARGVRVALDDFGTGYSSLATLRAFPFDKLKIDRSFIAGMGASPGDQDTAIVHAVLGLARGLGLPVVAEGVETSAQFGALRDAGCQEVQGWLVGRPAPIGSFGHLTGTPAPQPGEVGLAAA